MPIWRHFTVSGTLVGRIMVRLPLVAALTSLLGFGAVCADDAQPVQPPEIPVQMPTDDAIVLTSALDLLEDPTGQLSLAEIQSVEYSKQFVAATGSPNLGFSTSAWWVRFQVENRSDQATKIYLRQDYPLIDYLDLWTQDSGGQWQQHATGDRRPFNSRDIANRTFLFPMTLPAHTVSQYYMRFQSNGPIDISLSLHPQEELLVAVSEEQLALGLYYGGFLVLAIYNMFIFLAVKDRTFSYYLFYVVSYGLYFAVHNGLTYQFLWPSNPWLANQSLIILLGLSLVWGLQFSRSILSLKTISPRTNLIALWLQALSILGTVAAPFVSYRVMILPLSLLTVATTILMMAMGGLALLAKAPPARYFVLAWSTLLVGVLLYMLKTFGILPHNTLTQNGFQIGSLIEMILLSLALGSHVNELQRQTNTDPLTGLGNRRQFNEQLAIAVKAAAQNQQELSLLIVDIDHFKQFNDQHGHAAGDKAIRAVADVLAKHVRKPFLACRYGGEEFVMLLPDTNHADAVVLAERLRQMVIADTRFAIPVTVSVGLASYDDESFSSAERLFEAADFALYSAKAQGRNRVVTYRECLSRRANPKEVGRRVEAS